MDDCTTYEGMLSIVLPDGSDITSDSTTVNTVGIYQFGSEGFVRQVPWLRNTVVTIGVEQEKSLILVAWGNLQTDTLQVIPPSVGNPPDSALVSLRTKADGYQFPAPDLFYGRYEAEKTITGNVETDRASVQQGIALTRSAETQTFSLVMERIISALSVHILHAAEHFDGDAGTLQLIVRGTATSLDFRGNPLSGTAVYSPVLQPVSGADEWATSLFRVFPTPGDNSLSLELYRNDKLVLAVTTDYNGNALQTLAGKKTVITVDFRYALLHVGVTVEPWGSNTDQKVQL